MANTKYIIGEEVKKEVHRQGMTVAVFTDRINTRRANVYNIFRRGSMDTSLLLRISKVLHRNFLRELAILADNDIRGI